jgi:hypothetical protein
MEYTEMWGEYINIKNRPLYGIHRNVGGIYQYQEPTPLRFIGIYVPEFEILQGIWWWDKPQNLPVSNPNPVCYVSGMTNLSALTSAQFKRAAEIIDQLETLNTDLAELLGQTEAGPVQPSTPDPEPVKEKRKYRLSAVGKAKKRAALKARWAKVNAEPEAKAEAKPARKRRKMSAEGRARIALAAKARWARVRAGKGK